MRSRSNSLEDAEKAELSPPRARARRPASEREEACHAHEDTPTIQRKQTGGRRRAQRERSGAGKSRDLSRDDLLFLLSMLEGELQVTD